MILIISTCKQKLHENEFVKPIENILKKFKIKTIHYTKIKNSDIKNSKKIIISGTSLKDIDYLKHPNKFNWIKNYKNPILGICAGMQILALQYNGEIKNNKEIGLKRIIFEKKFLNIENEITSYTLHKKSINSREFETYAKSNSCIQAIKHKSENKFGVLFHPEVRNPEIILNFARL
jgi:GMP synthase-like glutamine amidotransferase